ITTNSSTRVKPRPILELNTSERDMGLLPKGGKSEHRCWTGRKEGWRAARRQEPVGVNETPPIQIILAAVEGGCQAFGAEEANRSNTVQQGADKAAAFS